MKNGILAFCGSKGSGKSTSASIFRNMYKGPTEELAFASHLKVSCSKVFGIDMDYFLNPSLKEVELTDYAVLTSEKIMSIFQEFKVESYSYDKHVRPHVGTVCDKPRYLLQYVGTEVLRPIDPLIHINATLRGKDPSKLSIITDMRFLNEYKALKDRPGFLGIYVQRSAAEYFAASDSHSSEKELDLFKDSCTLLLNNGTESDLQKSISNLISSHYGDSSEQT